MFDVMDLHGIWASAIRTAVVKKAYRANLSGGYVKWLSESPNS